MYDIVRILLVPVTLTATLSMPTNSRTTHYDLGDAAQFTRQDAERLRQWNLLDPMTPTARHAMYRDVIGQLSSLGREQREAAVGHLRQQTDDPGNARSTHRAMTAAETAALSASGLVEVGAHRVTHSKLSA